MHRFYQMWQQLDCSAAHATATNPTGCLADLFPWVEVSIGTGGNGASSRRASTTRPPARARPRWGSITCSRATCPTSRCWPTTTRSATTTTSRSRAAPGRTASISASPRDVWYTNAKGEPGKPPTNQIENPNPQRGTNNWYTQDGYSGGSYSNCSDQTQPGVAEIARLPGGAVVHARSELPARPLLPAEQLQPRLFSATARRRRSARRIYTIPPQSQLSIANSLDKAGVSWTYYGESWNAYRRQPVHLSSTAISAIRSSTSPR